MYRDAAEPVGPVRQSGLLDHHANRETKAMLVAYDVATAGAIDAATPTVRPAPTAS